MDDFDEKNEEDKEEYCLDEVVDVDEEDKDSSTTLDADLQKQS
jgi:hypothetical protein